MRNALFVIERNSVFVDVTATLVQPFTTGVQRVVRAFASQAEVNGAELIAFDRQADAWYVVESERLEAGALPRLIRLGMLRSRRLYEFLASTSLLNPTRRDSLIEVGISARDHLGRIGSPRPHFMRLDSAIPSGRFLMLQPPANNQHDQAVRRLIKGGMSLRGFVHDTLPLSHPEWFTPRGVDVSLRYVDLMMSAERIATASLHVLDELRFQARLVDDQYRPTKTKLGVFPLPASLSAEASHRESGSIPQFVMLGSIEPRKNHMTAIEAFVNVLQYFPGATLNIVGTNGWGSQYGIVKRRARQHGKRIRLHRNLEDADVRSIVRESAALIYPSLGEGYGLPVVEALALGTPVITSNRAPLSDFVRFGGVRLVDPTDMEDLTRAMRDLADPACNRLYRSDIQICRLPIGWRRWAQNLWRFLTT